MTQTTREDTHHADVESIEQVKRQGCDEVDKQPGGNVVNADGARVIHHLARRAHKGGPEVQHYVCGGARRTAAVNMLVKGGIASSLTGSVSSLRESWHGQYDGQPCC